MSQGATGGKGGSAPSGPAFDAAAAKSGTQAGSNLMSKEQFAAQNHVPDFMLDDVYGEYQKQAKGAYGFQNAAQAQGDSSKQNIDAQTLNNRPDQTNAFGATSTWGVGPDGRPTQTSSLGGDLGGTASELQRQLLNANATPLDNGAQARQHAEDALYSRQTSRLDPQFAQRESALNAGLANEGLDPSSQAGRAEIDNFNRGRNDAYTSAAQQAIMGGGQEASRQQAMDLQSRLAPEQALQGLQGFTGQQGFNSAGAADPTQYLQAALAQYGGALQKYGIDQAGKNSTMGGIANLGGNLGAAALKNAPAAAAVAA